MVTPLNPPLGDSNSRPHPTCSLPGLSTGNDTAPSSELEGKLNPHSSLGRSAHLVVWRELWSGLQLLQASVSPPVSIASILRPLWGNHGQGPFPHSAVCLSTQHLPSAPHHGQSALCPPVACPAPFPGENMTFEGGPLPACCMRHKPTGLEGERKIISKH